MKPFHKKVSKDIDEVIGDIVKKGDFSLKKEVIDKKKVAAAGAVAAIGISSADIVEKVTKEGLKAQFKKGEDTISQLEVMQNDCDDCDDYDEYENSIINDKGNKIKVIFLILVIIFSLIKFFL